MQASKRKRNQLLLLLLLLLRNHLLRHHHHPLIHIISLTVIFAPYKASLTNPLFLSHIRTRTHIVHLHTSTFQSTHAPRTLLFNYYFFSSMLKYFTHYFFIIRKHLFLFKFFKTACFFSMSFIFFYYCPSLFKDSKPLCRIQQ